MAMRERPVERERKAAGGTICTAADSHGMTLLSVEQGRVYRANVAGAWIWSELQAGKRIEEIEAGMCERFCLGKEQAARDLRAFLELLNGKGLLASERRAA